MSIEKMCGWAIYPCLKFCADAKCFELLNPRDIHLRANSITNINTGLKIIPKPSTTIKINNHLCNKPWRILCKFIKTDEKNHLLVFPAAVTKNITLKAFQPLCHIQFIPIKHALQHIIGKPVFIFYSY